MDANKSTEPPFILTKVLREQRSKKLILLNCYSFAKIVYICINKLNFSRMANPSCPKCKQNAAVKSGVVKDRQRYKCKQCNYFFTVNKQGKSTDPYYVIKALQLYVEGISLREIERILGVSHVSVRNWVQKHGLIRPESNEFHPTYKVFTHKELQEYLADRKNLLASGCIITELGDKYMMIKWERFRRSSF